MFSLKYLSNFASLLPFLRMLNIQMSITLPFILLNVYLTRAFSYENIVLLNISPTYKMKYYIGKITVVLTIQHYCIILQYVFCFHGHVILRNPCSSLLV